MDKSQLDKDVYVLKAEQLLGPYSQSQIANMISNGLLDPRTMVKFGQNGKVFPAATLQKPRSSSGPKQTKPR